MLRRFLYFTLLGLFINIPFVFAFPNDIQLEVLLIATAETQKKVANADYFLEKGDSLKALNGIQKKFLAPAVGLKNITEFLESIADLPLAEQKDLIQKAYETTVRLYEATRKQDQNTKIEYKDNDTYVTKVKQRQALHEELPRMEWEALALEEASKRGRKAGIAFAEQEVKELLKKGEFALFTEQQKPSYLKIKQNAVQSHNTSPVRPVSAPKLALNPALVDKARESARRAGVFLKKPVQVFFDPATGNPSYQVMGDKNRTEVLTPDELADLIIKKGNRLSNSAEDSAKTMKALEALESLDAVVRAPQPKDPIVRQKPIEVAPQGKPSVVVPKKPIIRRFVK